MSEEPWPIGTVVADRYVVCRNLGRGGFSDALLVQDTVAAELRVLKIAISTHRADAIRREASVLARVHHPNIVRTYDSGSLTDGRTYFVCEWIDGMTLKEILRDELGSIEDRLTIAARIAWALDEIHRIGIIHRDVKPGNVIVPCTSGSLNPTAAKLIDLSVLKVMAPQTEEEPAASEIGRLSGTIRYMAPEQLAGTPETPAVDVYGFGVLLYELLVGVTPLADCAVVEIMSTPVTVGHRRLGWTGPFVLRRLTEDFDVPSIPSVPPSIAALIGDCLRRQPPARPQSLRIVAEALDRALAPETVN